MTAKVSRRCHRCGREVEETRHTRASYRVGYYALHGGEVEAVTLVRPADEQAVTVLRLVKPMDWYTCVDCYRLPGMAAEREALFRPERRAQSCAAGASEKA